MKSSKNAINPLMELGLTGLESQIYAFLVENSPATGYRIANGINKPTANTYKALHELLAKGIVIGEDSTPRAFRAVPIAALLERLEKRFQKMKALAAVELAQLKPAVEDEKIYRLQTAEHVYERFREMLMRAEKIVLLDLFPAALAELKDEVEATAERGVHVVLKLYRPADLRGCIMVVEPSGPEVIARWPGVAANAIVDGREHLIAFLSPDQHRVHDAIWSRNTVISANFHGALFAGILLLACTEGRAGSAAGQPKKYRQLLALKGQGVPGFTVLRKRYQENRGSGDRNK
ncbi:MAG TPA: helix-turn-helix domain-containing protein [Patescibacteria group bacterium]|nr:helix-turn-helix domain-containing protein [Patescibacteria group bacterium]